MKSAFWVIVLFILSAQSLFAEGAAGLVLAESVDILWVCVAAALVFFMQAGFLMLETGLVRSKNSINVAVKNLIDYTLGSLLFFIVGYGLMFGTSFGGLIGTDLFLLDQVDAGKELAFFLFQVAFMGTAATIVSGAVAERIRFGSYLIISGGVSLIIYPIFGHWTWGGGWLSQLGFIDFAGSTVVHSIGGWVSLAGVLVLGPRVHRFSADGKPRRISGHNLPLSVLGAFVLWFGWFGFNGGSTLAVNDTMPLILVNTSIAGAAGSTLGLIVSGIVHKQAMVEDAINGLLAGLVAITANCDAVTPGEAMTIGSIGALVAMGATWFLESVLKVDDVVGAFPVHGAGGMWGTLACAIFADHSRLNTWEYLGVQGLGIAVCAAWAFGVGLLLFGSLNWISKIRVSRRDEELGLNLVEHQTRTTFLELMEKMNQVSTKQDFTTRIDIDVGTETAAVGRMFNRFLWRMSGIFSQFRVHSNDLDSATAELADNASAIAATAEEQAGVMEETTGILSNIQDAFTTINRLIFRRSEEAQGISGFAEQLESGFSKLDVKLNESAELARFCAAQTDQGKVDLHESRTKINAIQDAATQVSQLVTMMHEVSDKLNLLSLNAAIEAARSGTEGHGFAVVAEEINKLAARAANYTKDAKTQITNINTSVENGVSGMARAVESFDTIRENVGTLSTQLMDLSKSGQSQRLHVDALKSSVEITSGELTQASSVLNDRVTEIKEVFGSLNVLNDALISLSGQSEQVMSTANVLRDKSGLLRRMLSGFKLSAHNGRHARVAIT